MCGWNEPEKHEFEHAIRDAIREAQEELIEVLARMRGSGAAQNISVPE
jgi:hypothetical protein